MSSIIISISYSASRGKMGSWFSYMTSINHILVTLYSLSCLAMQLTGIRGLHTKTANTTGNSRKSLVFLRFAQVHWFLFNVASNVCTFVFFSYWILMFPTDTVLKNNEHPLTTYITIDRHGINLLLLLLDFFLSCTPVRLLHFVYPLCTIALFFVYNSIYWASTGALVYGKVLDYGNNTGQAVALVFVAVFIASPAAQFVWFLLFLCRRRLATKKENEFGSSYELADHSSNG